MLPQKFYLHDGAEHKKDLYKLNAKTEQTEIVNMRPCKSRFIAEQLYWIGLNCAGISYVANN